MYTVKIMPAKNLPGLHQIPHFKVSKQAKYFMRIIYNPSLILITLNSLQPTYV